MRPPLSAAIGALGQADTFSDYSRAIYDESRTLADALGRASGGNLACAAAVLLYVAARPWPLAWLRASYIRGLCGKGGLPRPTWTSVVRLVLLDVLVGTPLTFAIGGLEKADLASLGAPLLLLVLVFTLYADYAIVVDELTLRQALRSSLHVLCGGRLARSGSPPCGSCSRSPSPPRSGRRSTAAPRRSP